MQRNKIDPKLIIQSLVIWLGSAFFLIWFWDQWLLDGPHGPYRWVGMDFVPFWAGVQQMLKGLNPYTPEVTLKIQEVIYGGPAGTYDPMMFVYPAWIFLFFIPFSLLPLSWAVVIYGSSLILALFLMMKSLAFGWAGMGNKARAFWWIILMAGALPFIIISAMKGQLGYISLIALFLSRRWWAKRPILAGVALGFAVIKPTVTIIPVAGFLLWALYEKNWKVLAGFSGLILLLFSTSLLASGFWVPEYLQMLSITGGMPVLWSQQILVSPWNFIYAAYFLAILVFGFIKSIKSGDPQPWFSATLLGGIALIPMRWIYDLFLGILIPQAGGALKPMVAILTGVAILSPWALVFVEEASRWNFAVILMPLVWSGVFLVQNISAVDLKQ